MTPLYNPHATGFSTSIQVRDRRARRRIQKFDFCTLDFKDSPRNLTARPARRFTARRAVRLAEEMSKATGRVVLVHGWYGVKRVLIATINPDGRLG